MTHPTSVPSLVIADRNGNITDFPDLQMVGASNGHFAQPELTDLIPLPPGSELFALPGRLPVGWDPADGEPALLDEYPYDTGGAVQAVAAFMAPAHTAIFSPAYKSQPDAPTLPLFAYTAIGWLDGKFWVAGFRSDPDVRQDSDQYRQGAVIARTKKKLQRFKDNRLVQHLGKCCLTYGCPAARNFFLDRWEAPLPTSPSCNARCLGCISLQEAGCCRATQDRINFVPSVQEICDMAVPHLQQADNPIMSFGQGCEGEPLLQANTLHDAIIAMRSHTKRGTINLNSNASLPSEVARLARAGLDSLRVSLNSAQEEFYLRYYRPRAYRFSHVMESIARMKENGRFVSLNYFVLPGFTDSAPEFDALCTLVSTYKPDFIQLRNLNIDPEWYRDELQIPKKLNTVGIKNWLQQLQLEFPQLRFGYFNPQVNPPT